MDDKFRAAMADGYRFTEPTIILGGPMLGDDVLTDVKVQARGSSRPSRRPRRLDRPLLRPAHRPRHR